MKFIAIPVGQGDSFYLKTEKFSALVDGGSGKANFPTLFSTHTQSQHVDYLVCTHNDADHANGIIGFLQSNKLTCNEVWLPGSWADGMDQLIAPLDLFIHNVIEEMNRIQIIERTQLKRVRLKDIYDDFNLDVERDNRRNPNPEQSMDSIAKRLSESQPWQIRRSLHMLISHLSNYGQRNFHPVLSFKLLIFMSSVINAADRIRTIARLATKRGIPIRWFEYDPHAPWCGTTNFKIINAKPLTYTPQQNMMILMWLSLTVANKESLVLWSKPYRNTPGVLFNADSDLANIVLPTNLLNAIATAPHHGAQANAHAYQNISNVAGNNFASIIWIRSDSKSQLRPGAAYLSQGNRHCTICRTSTGHSNKQAIEMYSPNGVWQPSTPTHCQCI